MNYKDGTIYTSAGRPMRRFSRVMEKLLAQAESEPFAEQLRHPENAALVAGIKLESGLGFDGFTREEYAIELLAETIWRLMTSIAKAIEATGPDEALGSPLGRLAVEAMTATTVYGISLRAGSLKTVEGPSANPPR